MLSDDSYDKKKFNMKYENKHDMSNQNEKLRSSISSSSLARSDGNF
jgi:hypothetical protein